jgi:hypothetical protein
VQLIYDEVGIYFVCKEKGIKYYFDPNEDSEKDAAYEKAFLDDEKMSEKYLKEKISRPNIV